MANTIQIKRGLEADRSSVTPAAGEFLYTTDDKKVYVGDGTTAGGNEVGGGGGAAIEATASGALANGDMVVVNSDGTVSVVEGTAQVVSSPTVFNSATSVNCAITYDSANEKVVIAYYDGANSNYGTAVVGTVSGTSISFGTPVVFESALVTDISCTYDSANGKVVIAYSDFATSGYGNAIVGTVSGTSISFGTATVFKSAATAYTSTVYDSANGKVVIAYQDTATAARGTAIVGTISGTSISFGSPVQFEIGDTLYISAVYDSANEKVVIAFSDLDNIRKGKVVVGTVSGTSISFGAAVNFEEGNTYYISSTYDSTNGKIVLAYRNANDLSSIWAIVGTVSGTSITFGAAVAFGGANSSWNSSTYNSASNKVVISYKDGSNSDYGTLVVGQVSGNSITFEDPIVFESAAIFNLGSVYDSAANEVVIVYRDTGNSNYGTAVVFQIPSGNLTASNFIGVSADAYADAATATIQIVGAVDDAQTGLTAGNAYYVLLDGTLSTTAGDPSVFAGTAISSTQLIVKG